MFVRTLNADIQKNVSPWITLEKSGGYWYAVYDDGVDLETHSVPARRLRQLSRDQWLGEARELSERVERIRKSRSERLAR